jgi:hypothetical protein
VWFLLLEGFVASTHMKVDEDVVVNFCIDNYGKVLCTMPCDIPRMEVQ